MCKYFVVNVVSYLAAFPTCPCIIEMCIRDSHTRCFGSSTERNAFKRSQSFQTRFPDGGRSFFQYVSQYCRILRPIELHIAKRTDKDML